jgi:outer membrane PBP1 activator LpoA protein
MLFVISACTGNTNQRSQANSELDVAQEYLQKARNAKGAERNTWLFNATEVLLDSRRTDKALGILQQINVAGLSEVQKQRYYALSGQSLLLAERYEQAIQQFIRISNLEALSAYQQENYYRSFADTLMAVGRTFESAKQRLAQLKLIRDELEQEAVKEQLWMTLQSIPNPSIYQTSLNSRELEGWLDLAVIARTYEDDPEMMIRALEVWQGRYRNDIPANFMPLELSQAMSVQTYQPERLAVLLPMTGTFANSAEHLRRGIMAAHYTDNSTTELLFFDTATATAVERYQEAVDAGAQFVIGPLQQSELELLLSSEFLPVPILATNRVREPREGLPETVFQFGLPIEDEVKQAAEHILEKGFKRGLLLLPEGQLGDRAEAAFMDVFEQQEGIVQNVLRYQDGQDYAKPVEALLGIDQSFQRHTRLQQLAGVTMEFQARRRQDIDFIFIIADPVAGRRIKPFIDYYYAHDVPIFANSGIYLGKEDPTLDNDLNNINFPTIPFLDKQQSSFQAIRNELSSYWPESNEGIAARLFALGYDSYELIPELSKLRNFPNYSRQGLTGTLTVDNNGLVQRQLPWSRFEQGLPVTIEDNGMDASQSQ